MTAVAQTLLALCPVCGSDNGEPQGVTGTMEDARVAVVVMRCGGCSLVYLSPDRGALGGVSQPLPTYALSRRRIGRWTYGLPDAARILVAGHGSRRYLEAIARYGNAAWTLEGMDIPSGSRSYGLIILSHSLEAAMQPEALLRQVKSLLCPGGRVIAILSNPDSSCFGTFGGRHWSGYRYPGARQLFSGNAVRQLCREADLELRDVYTLFASDAWLSSTANWLRDWGASGSMIKALAGRWFVPRAMAAAIEGVATLRNRGSLLVAELEQP